MAPSAAQRAAVERLGARASWNRFGAPRSLFRDERLAGRGPPAASRPPAAREFVRRNAALYRLSEADVARARAARRPPAHAAPAPTSSSSASASAACPWPAAGCSSVGIVGGRVAYASGSLGGAGAAAAARSGSAARMPGCARRATSACRAGARRRRVSSRAGFGQLRVRGLPTLQQVREVAVPTPRDGVRRAYEVNVVDNGRAPAAWTVLVDAETGAVLRRVDRLGTPPPTHRTSPTSRTTRRWTARASDRRIVGCFPAAAAPPAGCTFDERMAGRRHAGAVGHARRRRADA